MLPPILPDNSSSHEALAATYSAHPPLNIVIQIVGSRGMLSGTKRREVCLLHAYSPQATYNLLLR